MAKYSDRAWSEAGAASTSTKSGAIGNANGAATYMTAGEMKLMSRFSLISSIAQQTDSDATNSSSTSSSSASTTTTNYYKPNTLSLSPAIDQGRVLLIKQQHQHQVSNHLLQLQKEIKEEEEEIFADINSLINSRSNLYSNLDDYDDEEDAHQTDLESHHYNGSKRNNNNNNNIDLHAYLSHNVTTARERSFPVAKGIEDINEYHPHHPNHNHQPHQNRHPHIHHQIPSANDTTNEQQSEDADCIVSSTRDDLHFYRNHDDDYHYHDLSQVDYEAEYMEHDDDDDDRPNSHRQVGESVNIEQVDHDADPQYIDEHEFDALGQVDRQNYQAIQAVIQQVTSNLPKPCVFFLEGNCRRSDCKYSHDLSNITCKYWIEGFCFKGEMCPFLHSYTLPDSQDPTQLDQDGLSALTGRQLDPTFTIESEADFPSLPLDAPPSTLNDSTKSSISTDAIAATIKSHILSSNPAVVFKATKKKRKRG